LTWRKKVFDAQIGPVNVPECAEGRSTVNRVDGSDCSLHAVQHAVRLAGKTGGCSIHIALALEQMLVYGEIAAYVRMKESNNGSSE
jgi:nucleotide-binding universal stress UspA family protein